MFELILLNNYKKITTKFEGVFLNFSKNIKIQIAKHEVVKIKSHT